MRQTKHILVLFLSTLIVLTGCQKDSVQPKKESQKTEHKTVVKNEATKPEQKNVATQKTVTPATTKEVTAEPAKDSGSSEPKAPEPKTTTQSTPPPAPKVVEATVSVQVIGYQGKTIITTANVPIQQGDTALLATQKILKSKGIPMSVRGSGASAYVDGIGNDFAGDHGPMSGWLVSINGKKIGSSSGVVKVKKGDKVLWNYSTDGN